MTQQQTTTRGTGPRGWERLVAQLNAAPDLGAFHRGMLDVQCKIVAAEYGALWVRGENGEPRPLEAWPKSLGQVPLNSPMMTLLAESAKSGFERGASHVLKAEPENPGEAPDLGAHIFVTVLRAKGQVVAVSTVVAECRDAQVLQSTQPLRELAAGLYEGFFARQDAAAREQDAQRVRQAMAILAVSQEATGFAGSCLNLVNELARQLKCTRVSLGWIRGRGVRLVAMSDTEHLKRHSEQVAGIEMAMAECLDQQQPIVYPVPEGAEPLLLHAVVHAHRKVTGEQPNRYVVSLPLRHRDDWIGVVTLERIDAPFDPGTIQYLQLVADVAAPHLQSRYESDRFLIFHAWHSLERALAYLVGPKHTGWKAGAIALLALLVFLAVGTWGYRVTAPFTFEAETRRLVPAPFDARLEGVTVEPGDRVEAGQVLAQLDVTEATLQREKARAKLNEYIVEEAKARGKAMAGEADSADWADAKKAEANIKETQAQIALLDYTIEKGTLKAPVAGQVLAGDWKDKLGGVVKQGDAMFEIAPLDDPTRDIIAVLHVSESDIDLIAPKSGDGGRRGELATRSEPQETFPFEVVQIVPLATPVEGANAFEVRARLLPAANQHERDRQDWLRPGMSGLAKIDAGRQPIRWILTHRIVDTIRLWVWM
jgi:multidrug efflux pump subunit AcrA (membrane-fusion protein)